MILLHYKTFHLDKFVSEGVVLLEQGIDPDDVINKWSRGADWKYRKAGVYEIKGTITPIYTLPFHEIRVISDLGRA